ncbi:MAG TPA: ROK family protein, partial [Myxococcaceae bacterium]|nr:ROK family protein [Myxococcaceae bacterium]
SLAQRMREELDQNCDVELGGGPSRIRELVGGDLKRITASTIDEAASQGDAYAQAFVREAADALANAMVWYVTVLKLDTLVLGGGVLESCPVLTGEALRYFQDRKPDFLDEVQIVRPSQGALAGALGAAYL